MGPERGLTQESIPTLINAQQLSSNVLHFHREDHRMSINCFQPLSAPFAVALLVAIGTFSSTGRSQTSAQQGSVAPSSRAAAPSAAAPTNPQASLKPNLTEESKKFPKQVKELMIDDLKVGRGRVVKPDSKLTVNYSAWLYDSGEPLGRGALIDSSLGKAPYVFQLGSTEAPHIRGWEEGFKEMKVGGKRRLLIPPDFAYGDKGAGKHVPPGATLLYEIDLVEVD